jgi:DNA-binding MarR family transcriptional regulator
MSLDQRAQILEAAVSTAYGVRDLVHVLKWKSSNVVSLLREMNKERLIDLRQATHSRRGRPKKNIICTPLGLEFLETHRKLKMKPLRARKEDLEHAVRDASHASRLVANGHSPFQIFMELNTIARNIKVSSETPETIPR